MIHRRMDKARDVSPDCNGEQRRLCRVGASPSLLAFVFFYDDDDEDQN